VPAPAPQPQASFVPSALPAPALQTQAPFVPAALPGVATNLIEREHPGVHVVVQQVPWSAAHEKLITAYVGKSTPDVSQLGNTWIPEFSALEAIEPLRPWLAKSAGLDSSAFFPCIWDTNVIDGEPYGVPWYVDTRVVFYRKDILRRAGYGTLPQSWEGWREAMRAVTTLPLVAMPNAGLPRAGGVGATATAGFASVLGTVDEGSWAAPVSPVSDIENNQPARSHRAGIDPHRFRSRRGRNGTCTAFSIFFSPSESVE